MYDKDAHLGHAYKRVEEKGENGMQGSCSLASA